MTTFPALPMVAVALAGEHMEIHPLRALYWARRQTLIIADAHFGKAAAFRAAGVFVPEETTSASLRRMDTLLDQTGASRIVFLGDFLHAVEGRHPGTFQTMIAWRERRSAVEMVLVRGNHDRTAGDPPESLGIRCVDAPLLDPPFAFTHHPGTRAGAYVLAGHIHPGVKLVGPGRQRDHFACFWFGEEMGVLPAFGEFTGFADVEPLPHDRVWVVAHDELISVGRSSER